MEVKQYVGEGGVKTLVPRMIGQASSELPSRAAGVVSGRDGVGLADLAVAACDSQLASTSVAQDLPRAVGSLGLGVEVAAAALASRVDHVPATVRVGSDF